MAGRANICRFGKRANLSEAILGDIKAKLHSTSALSVIGRQFKHDIVGPTTPRSHLTRRLPPCQVALSPASRHSFASQSESDIKKTPLYDLHASKKAKFVPFGGYSMPLYYDDLSHVESHHWTREKASIFDVSHM